MSRLKHHIVEQGEAIFEPCGSPFYIVCCDCSLAHKVVAEKKNGGISLRMWRDTRMTNMERRKGK